MDTKIIANRLREARKAAGLTQKEVANRLGVTYQAISNYERGVNRIEASTLIRLCDLYSISTSDIPKNTNLPDPMFHLFSELFREEIEEDFGLSPHEQKIIDTYRSLPEQGKKFIETCLHAAQAFFLNPSDEDK